MSRKLQTITCFAIILGVLAIDQVTKVLVKTSMALHESIRVTDWFYIFYVENNGMAFGMEPMAKWMLSSFRIVAVVAIMIYLLRCIKRGEPMGYVVCLAFIVAGAAGNIIDCLFYGLIWHYDTLLNGRVVDMLYFPLVEWDWPAWMPLWGGQHSIFFSPIFNVADAAISCGIVALLLFYRNRLNFKE